MEPADQSEYVTVPAVVEERYTSFWPLVIVLAGLIGWAGYQDVVSYQQGSALSKEFKDAQPVIKDAEDARQRLYSLAQDLVQTGAKDPYAAQIAKENNIQLKSNANSGAGSDTTPSH